MTALSVNLNKIALLRNSRPHNQPDLLAFAQMALDTGVQGLTVHPRPDERHIRHSDVQPLSEMCQSAGVEFNMEGNPFAPTIGTNESFLDLVKLVAPTQCTLVPDSNDQLTSDHGWDLSDESLERLLPVIESLQSAGIRVALFMDADLSQIDGLIRSGVDRIELYTEPYARAFERGDSDTLSNVLAGYDAMAKAVLENGVGINAGHDLTLENLSPFLTGVSSISEVSIGHALTVDALKMGFRDAVAAYLSICVEKET